MVKFKSSPKQRFEAGYAARLEQPVIDTTIIDDDNDYKEYKQTISVAAFTTNQTSIQKKQNIFSNKTQFKSKTKPGVSALNEIKRLQSSTGHVIPKAPFLRVVKQITLKRGDFRFTEMAIEALREASENILTGIFEDAYLVSLHAKRVTLFPRDMALALTLRRDSLSNAMNLHP